MKHTHRVCLFHVTIAFGVLSGVALASRHSPDPGLSGGPAGWGASCNKCHDWNSGPGFVEIVGLPVVYEPDVTYDLTVLVGDVDQFGAGFEFSVEGPTDTIGTLIVTDAMNTQLFDDGDGHTYISHTGDGIGDSVDNWVSRGWSVEYSFQWQAPSSDVGPIRFYTAGNAIDDNRWLSGDHVYTETVTVEMKVDGDGDDDGDADFNDFGDFQYCFDESPLSEYCALFDLDPNGAVDLFDYEAFVAAQTGPTALGPSAFRHANAARGARLYDKWWVVNGASEPVGDHPLYPPEGQKSGSTTYRCKECHGWDYKGVDGAYGGGSHYTGIKGVYGYSLETRKLFDVLKFDTPPNGHDMSAYGLEDEDIWDLVKFLTEALADTDTYIDQFDAFVGDTVVGETYYDNACSSCHGPDGTEINFGTEQDPEYIGGLANRNPWEFLHKIRGGQPGRTMCSFIDIWYADQRAADVGAHSQTLP